MSGYLRILYSLLVLLESSCGQGEILPGAHWVVTALPSLTFHVVFP